MKKLNYSVNAERMPLIIADNLDDLLLRLEMVTDLIYKNLQFDNKEVKKCRKN